MESVWRVVSWQVCCPECRGVFQTPIDAVIWVRPVVPWEKESMDKRDYPAGIKWTRQRRDVYQVLSEAEEPLSALQIYRQLEETAGQSGYALSTVYRILAAFEEHDMLRKSSWMGEDTLLYELDRGDHTHYALCLDCRRRVPLENCPFKQIHDHLPGLPGDFVVTGHKLELYGYCKECRAKHMDDGQI